MTKASEYHHGNLRQALIEAGVRLIQDRGSIDISLREVARAAGVSHAAPYRHFKGRNALMSGIAEVGFRHLADEMAGVVEKYPDNPRQQLIEAGVAYIRIAMESSQIFHLMFGGVVECNEENETLQQASAEAFGGLEAIIQSGRAAGLYRRQDSEVMALSAWSLVHGYAMLASTGRLDHVAPDERAMLELARQVESFLVDGIGL